MDKKGEKLMTFWWFLANALVFTIIVGVTVNFYSKPVDTREIQTKIIYSEIYDCLVKNSYIYEDIFYENFSLSNFCNLRDTLSMQDSSFLVKVDLLDQNSRMSVLSSPIILGDSSLIKDCEVSYKGTSRYFPFCLYSGKSTPVYYIREGKRKVDFLDLLVSSQYYGKKLFFLGGKPDE